MPKSKQYYSAKCIFKFDRLSDENGNVTYEERVVIFKANDFDDAIDIAEKDAEEYAKREKGEYLGFVNVYKPYENKIKGIYEVYSSMRKSDLCEDDYLDKLYDTGEDCKCDYEKLSKNDIDLIFQNKKDMSSNIALTIKQMHIVEKKNFTAIAKDILNDVNEIDDNYLANAKTIGKKLVEIAKEFGEFGWH